MNDCKVTAPYGYHWRRGWVWGFSLFGDFFKSPSPDWFEPVYTEAACNAAVKAEREACAKVCEAMHDEDRPSDYAYAIMARSKR